MNYIFIDYENIQEFDLGRIANKPVRAILVHKKLALSLTKALLQHSGQVQLVETGVQREECFGLGFGGTYR